jgi:hypothetical protein
MHMITVSEGGQTEAAQRQPQPLILLLVLLLPPAPQVSEDESADVGGPRRVVTFAGPAVTLPLVLTYAGRGGQVMHDAHAWCCLFF